MLGTIFLFLIFLLFCFLLVFACKQTAWVVGCLEGRPDAGINSIVDEEGQRDGIKSQLFIFKILTKVELLVSAGGMRCSTWRRIIDDLEGAGAPLRLPEYTSLRCR